MNEMGVAKDLEMKGFSEMKKFNAVSVGAYTTICAALVLAYLIEFFKGNRTLGYTLVFTVLVLVPLIICIIVYQRKKDTPLVKYFFSVGYSVLYAFVLLTAHVNLTFAYIILLIILLSQYADFKLSLLVNIYALLMNVFQVAHQGMTQGLSKNDIVNAEIQIIVILLIGAFSVMTTIATKQVNDKKVEALNKPQL